MLDRVMPSLGQRGRVQFGPIHVFKVDHAYKHINARMERVGGLQQPIEVFDIGGSDMPDHVDGKEVGPIGIDAADRWQTLPPFNHLGEKLEWRLSNDLGRWMPVATIVRYHTAHPETGEDKGQVLVVTQLAEGNSCHIAYIDALANPDANELAREAADASGNFDCASDEVEIIGKFEAY